MNSQNIPDNPSVEVIKAGKTGLLRNYIFKAIPLAFDESMSYYECLCGLLDYLKNTIIPTVNNNGDAVIELQDLYEELKSYMDNAIQEFEETVTGDVQDLEDYMNNYFDNLNVQQEINNKLDQMVLDGTMQTLIGAYVSSNIQPQINTQNQRISVVENELTSVASGSPLVATSTSEMTDTTRTYVNTTDGNWYYYDGDSWEIGGTYQSTGIAPEEINYLMLDETLKNMYIEDLTFLNLGSYTEGYIPKGNLNATITFDSSQYFSYYKVDISDYIGKILHFNAQTMSIYSSCIITDDEDKIVYKTEPSGTGGVVNENGYLVVTNTMKYIYLLVNASQNNIKGYTFINLAVLSQLKLKLAYNVATELDPISYFTYGYIDTTSQTNSNGEVKLSSINNATCNFNVIKMCAGYKYTISGINMPSNPARTGFVLCDNNFKVITSSSTLYGTGERFTYTFTATYNGYICVTTDREYNSQKAFVYQYDTMSDSETSLLTSKKVGFTGDSICAGDGYSGGYATILHDNYGLEVQNIGVSGGHLAHDREGVFVICDSIDDLDDNCDAYIIEGGINDYANNITFGTITANYTADVDDTTFVGALEKTCRSLYNYHSGKKFAFLIVHDVLNYYCGHQGNGKTWKDYRDAIYEVCTKYGIDVIDIGKTSMNTNYTGIKNNYTASSDGLHPNQAGYTKYYVPAIKEWILNNLF